MNKILFKPKKKKKKKKRRNKVSKLVIKKKCAIKHVIFNDLIPIINVLHNSYTLLKVLLPLRFVVNVILCFILSKLVPCVFLIHINAFQLLRIPNRNQNHKCKLDSFPIFLIVRSGISLLFRYFGFVLVSLVTRILWV